MLKIIWRGVTWIPPLGFLREVLALLGVEDPAEVTAILFEHLGFKRG